MDESSAREEIQRIAYELWQVAGEPDGQEHEHWARAKRIYESRRSGVPTEHVRQSDMPGPRNPEPLPATNAEGYAPVPSSEDAVPGALKEGPRESPPLG